MQDVVDEISAVDDSCQEYLADREEMQALLALDAVKTLDQLLAWALRYYGRGAGAMRCPERIMAEMQQVLASAASASRTAGPPRTTYAFIRLPSGKGHARPTRVAKVVVSWPEKRIVSITE